MLVHQQHHKEGFHDILTPRFQSNQSNFAMAAKHETSQGSGEQIWGNVDTEVPIDFTSEAYAARICGFINEQELREFFESELWKPYVTELNNKVFVPVREKAKAENNPVPRLVNFSVVEAILDIGEINGRQAYTGPDIDKTNFEPIDW